MDGEVKGEEERLLMRSEKGKEGEHKIWEKRREGRKGSDGE